MSGAGTAAGRPDRSSPGRPTASLGSAARRTKRWTPGEVREVIARAGSGAASVAGSICEWVEVQPHIRVTGGIGVSYPSVTLSG